MNGAIGRTADGGPPPNPFAPLQRQLQARAARCVAETARASIVASYALASLAWHDEGVFDHVQVLLDKSTPHTLYRWLGLAALLVVYAVRVYFLQGFYIITYAMAIYMLNLFLGFLTPQINPELEGPTLPSKSDEEFRPFVRRLPEFKFWWNCTKAVLVGSVATLIPLFDFPVYWPILVFYWFILFFVTMKRQIQHMIKYRYLPFSFGKRTYGKDGGKAAKNAK